MKGNDAVTPPSSYPRNWIWGFPRRSKRGSENKPWQHLQEGYGTRRCRRCQHQAGISPWPMSEQAQSRRDWIRRHEHVESWSRHRWKGSMPPEAQALDLAGEGRGKGCRSRSERRRQDEEEPTHGMRRQPACRRARIRITQTWIDEAGAAKPPANPGSRKERSFQRTGAKAATGGTPASWTLKNAGSKPTGTATARAKSTVCRPPHRRQEEPHHHRAERLQARVDPERGHLQHQSTEDPAAGGAPRMAMAGPCARAGEEGAHAQPRTASAPRSRPQNASAAAPKARSVELALVARERMPPGTG